MSGVTSPMRPRRATRAVLWIVAAIVVVLIAAGAFVLAARSGLLRPDEATLRARYALPNSKFMLIDGEPIHYVDEGAGDPIVLIHGSFDSLRAWDEWAAALKTRYRVIRFDRPPVGLSGPDPLGRYGTERELQVIEGLTSKLGLKHFFLVAASSGGESGAAYSADHPEQVRGLILSNIGVGPVVPNASQYPLSFKIAVFVDPLFNGWHPRALWRSVLEYNFADPKKVTPELVARWTDLDNRAQTMPKRAPAHPGGNPFYRTPGDLAKITAPTLLLWSDQDREVPLNREGLQALKLLGAEDKTLVVAHHCGHMITTECGPQTAIEALRFFDRIEEPRP